jgi:spore coat protein A
VDITIPGANQAQNRIATHIHGGLVPWISDGGPFDWWDPSGNHGLSFLNGPGSVFDNIPLDPIQPGEADYYYPNDQSERFMWYHDHAYGITRLTAYAGVASGYLIVDSIGNAYRTSGVIPDIPSTFPLVFQDKVFVDPATITLTDPTWSVVARPEVQSLGSLWYEHVYNPKEFRLLKSKKYLTPPNPSAIPEFFGDTMLCNGTIYPLFTVEAKRYRFIILNACNARFLNINLLGVAPGAEIATDPKTLFANLAVNPPGPPIIQIGSEGGFLLTEVAYPNNLPFNPATLTGNLLLGPAERADIIIDFTGMAGKEFMMYNDAPGPFPAGPPTTDYFLGNPKNPIQPLPGTGPDTRQILRFNVITAAVADPQLPGPILDLLTVDPPLLATPPTTVAPIPPLVPPVGTPVRDLTLNEDFDQYGRLRQLLGTTMPGILPGFGREYLEPATEIVQAGSTEVWRIFNLSADTHPIHFHLVNVQVLSRQPFKVVNGAFTPTGLARGPEPNELGWKETVQMHPGEVTSVIMKFDLPATASLPFTVPTSPRFPLAGLPGTTKAHEYVWHCHILEHEEHDMMRPLVVTEQ